MPKLLHHLDLTTGYHTIHRIDTFSRSLVNHHRKLLPHGGWVPHFAGQFRVSINGPRFTLFHRDLPIHEGGIGMGRDSTWIELHGIIKDLDWTLEAKPRPGLWLAEVPLPYIYELKGAPINWVFDFVRHLPSSKRCPHPPGYWTRGYGFELVRMRWYFVIGGAGWGRLGEPVELLSGDRVAKLPLTDFKGPTESKPSTLPRGSSAAANCTCVDFAEIEVGHATKLVRKIAYFNQISMSVVDLQQCAGKVSP